LLKTLGSVAALREASDEAILAVPGVTQRHLQALREAFAKSAATPPAEPATAPVGVGADETAAPADNGIAGDSTSVGEAKRHEA